MGTKTRPLRGEKEKKREKRQARVNETGSCLYHAVPHSTLSVLPSLGHVLGAGGWKAGWWGQCLPKASWELVQGFLSRGWFLASFRKWTPEHCTLGKKIRVIRMKFQINAKHPNAYALLCEI